MNTVKIVSLVGGGNRVVFERSLVVYKDDCVWRVKSAVLKRRDVLFPKAAKF